jgi:hypothetical protein
MVWKPKTNFSSASKTKPKGARKGRHPSEAGMGARVRGGEKIVNPPPPPKRLG